MAQEIRNYRFTFNWINQDDKTPIIEVVEAYDLNEALIQIHVKHGQLINVTEIIPFKYIEEQKPVVEQKKEVHVKPLPKNLSSMGNLGVPNRDWMDSGGSGEPRF